MTTYLSIDVGAKNMVFCKARHTTDAPHLQILEWAFLDCDASTVANSVSCLGHQLASMHASMFQDVDQVLIESQTSKNVKMKVLSHCLQYHFETSHDFYGPKQTIFCSPHSKLKICDLGSEEALRYKSNYNRNKFCAVQKCKEIIDLLVGHQVDGAEEHKRFFDTAKKQDDLADSLLQIACRLPQFKNAPQQQQRK